MDENLRAVCGLNCEKCPARIAFLTNDDKLREETASKWKEQFGFECSPSMVNCMGCRQQGDKHIGHWVGCPVRQCAEEKSVAHCADCDEFADCKTRKDFEHETGLDTSRDGWA